MKLDWFIIFINWFSDTSKKNLKYYITLENLNYEKLKVVQITFYFSHAQFSLVLIHFLEDIKKRHTHCIFDSHANQIISFASESPVNIELVCHFYPRLPNLNLRNFSLAHTSRVIEHLKQSLEISALTLSVQM